MAPRLRPLKNEPKPLEQPKLFGEPDPQEQKANEETPKPDEVVVVEEQPKPDEATVRLQKQIDDLKKSEELQRAYNEQEMRRRENELRRRFELESQQQREQFQREAQEQEEVAVGSALAAAKAEADKAQSDYVAALNAGDNSAAAEAQRRMSRAEARMVSLEAGKDEIEARKKAPVVRTEERPAPQLSPTGDPVDGFNLPDAEKSWLKAHRDFMTDQRKIIELDRAHRLAGIEGLSPGNPKYLPFIEGIVFPKQETEPQQEEQPQERSSIVSAPVSREVPSSTGARGTRQIRLTAEEREAAKMAGITEVEYAKQKQRLVDEKNSGNGEYTRSRYG